MLKDYTFVSWDKFNPTAISFSKRRGNTQRLVGDDIICLDTETSTSEDGRNAWVYQWCFYYNGELVYGRKPSQLAKALEKVVRVNELSENKTIVGFVHNLSYDYTYIHNHINKHFNIDNRILATGGRDVLTYKVAGIEFRDSQALCRTTLEKWAKDLCVEHCKLSGTIDYGVVRYQDSKLTRRDWRYLFYDVVTLRECVNAQIDAGGYSIISLPYTSTGYVRKDARKAFRKDEDAKERFKNNRMSVAVFNHCNKAFSGGITHGNRNYSDLTVRVSELRKTWGDDVFIAHRDFVSHYPTQQICNFAPATKFKKIFDWKKSELSWDESDLIKVATNGYCFVAKVAIRHLCIKDESITMPYAQKDKFEEKRWGNVKYLCDCGRILRSSGDGGSIVYITELDLKWLCKQYDFEMEVLDAYASERGEFPQYLKDTVNHFFYEKSYYKNECKKFMDTKVAEGYTTNEVERMADYRWLKLKLRMAKSKLNSIYGMTATSPVRGRHTEYEDGSWKNENVNNINDTVKELQLKEYYSGLNNFMEYPLGVWTTAHARNELMTFVEKVGYDRFLYCDTDSIFYISNPELEAELDAINAKFRAQDDAKGWFVEIDNKRVYYNQFEREKENIVEFRFLRAKCYAYNTLENNKKVLHCIVAGVSENGEKSDRAKELGSIERLTSGFEFRRCGGTVVRYAKKGETVKPRTIKIDGHCLEVSQYAIIEKSTRRLHSELEMREMAIADWKEGKL